MWDLPDLREREEIFKVHLHPLKVGQTTRCELFGQTNPLDFQERILQMSVMNRLLLLHGKVRKRLIDKTFLMRFDRIVGGLEKKSKIITPSEKKTIAFHEAGHATVSWMLEHAAPLVKVTIVPRGQSLGAAWYLPEGASNCADRTNA